MPDVDTSDRPGDGARTTPPVTPAPRSPGAPGSSTAPTTTAPGSSVGSAGAPSTNPTFGTSAPASAGSPAGVGSPASGPSAPGSTAPGSTATGSPTAGSSTAGPSTAGSSAAGPSAGDASTTGLVPAGRPTGGGRPGLNGARDGSAATARPDVQPLLETEYAATVRERWFGVQSAFVDDPESAVREASVVLEDSIAAIGRGLEKLRRSVTDAAEAAEGTEDLRVALLRHREVIGRLLQL